MKKVAIIGLGLIGGSLGLALKKQEGWEITGYSRRAETVDLALERGAIDKPATSLKGVVSGVELVVMATPIGAMPQVLAEMAPYLSREQTVTDTASVKGQILKWAEAYLPNIPFVGGHPMAGKETWGLEAAEAGMFQGTAFCLIPSSTAREHDIDLVAEMAEAVGAHPLHLSAQEHDHMVAGVSHLPLAVASALAGVIARDLAWPSMAHLAAGGYRDTTRLASGNPEMGRDICLANREALIPWIDSFLEELRRFRGMLDTNETQVEAFFARGRQARQSWLSQRSGKD